jgi:hypothetical protein
MAVLAALSFLTLGVDMRFINLCFFLFLAIPALAVDGDSSGWSGNGGGNAASQDNIWFLGKAPVKYCIFSSAGFPVNRRRLDDLVKESLNDWKQFFNKYHLDQNFLGEYQGRRSFDFPDAKARGLSLNFVEVGCDEAALTDPGEKVVFLFGVTSNPVDSFQEISSEGKFGLALRKNYNHKSYRNGGYIWINNFSQDESKIKHVLLHELGHVFGMKHNSVFVMNEYFDKSLQSDALESNFFGRIESRFWPYRLKLGEEVLLSYHVKQRGGERGRPLDRGRRKCSGREYVARRLFPEALMKALGFRRSQCIRMALKFVNVRAMKKGVTLALVFEGNAPGERQELKGVFEGYREPGVLQMGPGLYSRFVNRENNLAVWKRITLDRFQLGYPLRGSLEFGERTIPAQVDYGRGFSIDLFLPKQKKWWVIGGK